MFTGIIEDVGVVERMVGGQSGGKVLTIRTALDPTTIAIGDSVAVSGVCLTATRIAGPCFEVDAGPETLGRTTIGALASGRRVNLERALAIGDRLGGHMVQGHVDGVGEVVSVSERENAWDYQIRAPDEIGPLVSPRGSIAVDGISLTVTSVQDSPGAFTFGVSVIPHTRRETTLVDRRAGQLVNLEIDLIARYVTRFLGARGGEGSGVTEAFLKKHGFY